MTLHKPADICDFMINGYGYHMPTESYLHKWAWLTKEAGLYQDMLLYVHIITLI